MTDTKTNAANIPAIRILKIAACPSLSSKSSLTYHVGCDAEGAIYVLIHQNSGSGYWNRRWVSTDKIGKVLGESSSITSFTLQSACVGSQNNGGFLLAALLAEGLVNRSADNDRQYVLGDPTAFNAEVKALMESDVSLDPDAKPKKPSKKKSAPEAEPSTA